MNSLEALLPVAALALAGLALAADALGLAVVALALAVVALALALAGVALAWALALAGVALALAGVALVELVLAVVAVVLALALVDAVFLTALGMVIFPYCKGNKTTLRGTWPAPSGAVQIQGRRNYQITAGGSTFSWRFFPGHRPARRNVVN
ncbi:MAG: hypothetical protein OEV88_01570 [Gammaproteobacteria bacterium]|nr:hypothetical protein [Gammaproteobacteria bacterium]